MNSAPALNLLPMLQRRTLGGTAYDHLAELLASGRLAPGDRLSLRDVAAALGVSVMPVREAVNRLIVDRALEVAPNRAIRVPVMTVSGFQALAETRMAIEGLAAARAALNRTEAQLAAIRAAEAAFCDLAGQQNPDGGRAVRLNRDFHFAIYEAAGLAPLQEIIVGLWLKAGPVLNLDLRGHKKRLQHSSAVRRHAEALAAIEANDPAAASAAVAADIRDAADFIIGHGVLLAGER